MEETINQVTPIQDAPGVNNYYPIAFTNLNRDFKNSAEVVQSLQKRFRREIYTLLCDMEDHVAMVGIKKAKE